MSDAGLGVREKTQKFSEKTQFKKIVHPRRNYMQFFLNKITCSNQIFSHENLQKRKDKKLSSPDRSFIITIC